MVEETDSTIKMRALRREGYRCQWSIVGYHRCNRESSIVMYRDTDPQRLQPQVRCQYHAK